MSFTFMHYPVDSRLGWHTEGGRNRTGGYTFYLHNEWRPSWGGELIILDRPYPVELDDVPMTERLAAIEDAVSNSSTMLTAIYSRPNRLVMIRPGTYHYVNRVDRAAGSAKRRSLSGFVSRLDRRLSILTEALALRVADAPPAISQR